MSEGNLQPLLDTLRAIHTVYMEARVKGHREEMDVQKKAQEAQKKVKEAQERGIGGTEKGEGGTGKRHWRHRWLHKKESV